MAISGAAFLARIPTQTNVWGIGLLAVLVVAGLPVFRLGIEALVAAWTMPEYSHGPLIPLISLFLFLRAVRGLPDQCGHSSTPWPGVAVIVLGLCLAILGNLTQIPDFAIYGMIVWVAGVVLALNGWSRGTRLQWPVLHLVFMVPLPQMIYWKLSVWLQGIAAEMGVWVVAMAGVPVFLDGNIIDLGVYKLQVAEACSGLRYLFPILSFSYLFAILYSGPLWHKAVLLLAAVPVAIAMNALRIGMTGILVDAHGIALAEGFLHVFQGWFVFAGAIGVLLILAVVLQASEPTAVPLSQTLDVDTTGLGPIARRVFSIRSSGGLVAACLATIAASGLVLALGVPTAAPVQRAQFVGFPDTLGGWSATSLPLDQEVAETLAADDTLSVVLSRPDTVPVHLFAAYYDDLAGGSGLHAPEVCLPAAGWDIAALEAHPVDVKVTPYGTFQVNRAVVQKGTRQVLVYYWFEHRGARTISDIGAKFLAIRDGFTRGRRDGALIRLTTTIAVGEAPENADARLRAALHPVLGTLPDFIPF